MAEKRSGYIDVERLMPQVSLEQAAAFYGVPLPELHRVGEEVRTKCFLNCGRDQETGDRAVAIKADDPVKQWRCHQYGCGKGGNLISLCDLMKPGTHMDGKPRGNRFKTIRDDLAAMAGRGVAPAASAPANATPQEERIVPNVPLAESENQRARGLVNLDEKLLVDPAEMSPAAARYFRCRPFLTPDVCRQWRMGYLPRDTGGDKAGGTMRGRVVYPLLNDAGEVLTWLGRDPEFETKHQKWLAGGKHGKEPAKCHFVKGFQRGLELFGQEHFAGETFEGNLTKFGLPVVEGPNDVIRMHTLGVPAVGLTSNLVSSEQAVKIAELAKRHANGRVLLMLDCDVEGERGSAQALWELAQLGVELRLAWSRSMYGGQFADRQPESLTSEEWESLRQPLTRDQ